MFRRVVSTPGLHWFSAYLELSLYIIIEPTRSLSGQRSGILIQSLQHEGLLEVRVPALATRRGDPSQQAPRMFYRWRSMWEAARKVSPAEAARQRGTANRLMSRAFRGAHPQGVAKMGFYWFFCSVYYLEFDCMRSKGGYHLLELTVFW